MSRNVYKRPKTGRFILPLTLPLTLLLILILILLLILILILICRPFGRPRGGFAEWVDRHGCRESCDRAMDGPSQRAHGAGPERGTPERSEGRTRGRKRFGYFAAFAK